MANDTALENYFKLVLDNLGFETTAWRLHVLKEWAACEGIQDRLSMHQNPLATTWDENVYFSSVDIGHGPGFWNVLGNSPKFGVRMYPSAWEGAKATARTLRLSYYKNIIKALETQQYVDCTEDIKTWSGHAGDWYADRIHRAMRTSVGVPPTEPSVLVRLFGSESVLEEWLSKGRQIPAGFESDQRRIGELEVKVTMLTNSINTLRQTLKELSGRI